MPFIFWTSTIKPLKNTNVYLIYDKIQNANHLDVQTGNKNTITLQWCIKKTYLVLKKKKTLFVFNCCRKLWRESIVFLHCWAEFRITWCNSSSTFRCVFVVTISLNFFATFTPCTRRSSYTVWWHFNDKRFCFSFPFSFPSMITIHRRRKKNDKGD